MTAAMSSGRGAPAAQARAIKFSFKFESGRLVECFRQANQKDNWAAGFHLLPAWNFTMRQESGQLRLRKHKPFFN
jgi:hypothetical protein